MNRLEEELYARAAHELAAKSPVPGVMAKAIAEADGDEKKIFPRYIALRVEHLKSEIAAEMAKQHAAESQRRDEELRAEKAALNAWRRRGLLSKEKWRIQLKEDSLRFVDANTREDLTIFKSDKNYRIEFHPDDFAHKIVITNRRGEKFSFDASSQTVESVQAWWLRITT